MGQYVSVILRVVAMRSCTKNGCMKNAHLANRITLARIAFRMMSLTSENICLSGFVGVFQNGSFGFNFVMNQCFLIRYSI